MCMHIYIYIYIVFRREPRIRLHGRLRRVAVPGPARAKTYFLLCDLYYFCLFLIISYYETFTNILFLIISPWTCPRHLLHYHYILFYYGLPINIHIISLLLC